MSFDFALTIGDLYARARSEVSARRELAGNLSITVGTSVFIQLVTVASGVILARALGPQGRGDLAIAMLWPTLVSGVGTLGIADALTFRSALEGRGPSAALTNSLVLALFQSVLLVGIGWGVILLALHGKPTVAANAEFYLWYIPLNLLTLYPGALLQGRMMMPSFNLVRASVHVSYTTCLALLWATHHLDVRAALFASLLAAGMTLILCAAAVLHGRFVALRISVSELRSLITLGLKLQLGNIAFLLGSRIDIILLSLLVPTRVLGAYVVASAVGALPLLIPSAASLVLYPLFSRQQRAQAGRAFARFMLLGLFVTVSGAPVVIFVSPPIVKLFFGGAFEPAVVIAQILGLASLLRGMGVMVSAVLRGLGAPVRASIGDVAALVVMAALMVPAIRFAQGEGAAVAVLLGTATALSWMTYQGLMVVRMTPIELVRRWGAEFWTGGA